MEYSELIKNSEYFKIYNDLYIKFFTNDINILEENKEKCIYFMSFILDTFKPVNWRKNNGEQEDGEDAYEWILNNGIDETTENEDYYLYISKNNNYFYLGFNTYYNLEIDRFPGLLLNTTSINEISDIILHGRFRPVYSPKKNKRLLESKLHENYPYDSFIIKINNIDELNEISNILNDKYDVYISGYMYELSKNYFNINDNKKSLFLRLYFTENILTYEINHFNLIDEYKDMYGWSYEKIFTLNDLKNNTLDRILFMGKSNPDYNKKQKPKRLLESITDYDIPTELQRSLFKVGNKVKIKKNANKFFNDIVDTMIDMLGNTYEIYKVTTLGEEYRYTKGDIIPNYDISNDDDVVVTLKDDINFFPYSWYYKCLIPVNNNPNYNPKGKIIRENMITTLKEYLLLERSSLSVLGIPKEVMKPIQKDLAIPSDAKWNKISLKKDAIDKLNEKKKTLFLQIELDTISVFIFYDNKYFIDSYIMKEDDDWGGGYNKLPRQKVSKSHFISRIDSSVLLYHLNDDFSIKTQQYRKLDKKEKEFNDFTDNFKSDFLKNFNSILKRIVGYKYKEAKDEIVDKVKQVEIENKMMISGLENPLEGPNSLTILDQFIIEFEDEYSKYFDERLDIMELSELFTRDKIMTSFMLFIYSGKIITT
ncbi:MAG: hypothetical protein WDA02_04895 [Saccharofermentanales bacterium]